MSSSEEIAEQLAALHAQMEEAKEVLAPIAGTLEELNSQKYQLDNAFNEMLAQIKKEHNEKLEALQAKKKPIMDAMSEAQGALNNVNFKAQQLEAQLANAKAEEAAAEAKKEEEAKALQEAIARAEQDKVLTELWDTLTINATWREWAKDHQISGAHLIVPNRNVILADPMGLGKTLTSIITCDMAERATKEASPEFPWLGVEQEVFVQGYWKNVVTDEIIKGYVPYDKKNNLIADENWEYIEAHYEKKIVDAVERPVGRRVLYICPASLLRNVLDEWEMWAPHRNATFIGGMSKAERNFFLDHIMPKLNDVVVIVNYEAWRKDHSLLAKLEAYKFDTVIIDEAHNAKDRTTSVWKGINRLITGENRPEYVIPMTGTPILNKPQELFTLLNMVNPEEFRVEKDFLRRYCEQYEVPPKGSGVFRWRFQDGGLDVLLKKISKNIIRRTKDQAGIVLPPKTIVHHNLEVDEEAYPDQAKARDQMRKYATIVINSTAGKAISATAKVAIITRLRQIETWPAGIIQYEMEHKEGNIHPTPKKDAAGNKIISMQVQAFESQKVDYCIRYDQYDNEWAGLIPDAITDERMVLFSQFKMPLHEIADRVNKAGWKAVVLDGDTPSNLREEIRKDFDARHTPDRENSKWDIVLCNYKVGGVGFNFTAASQLIALDDEWNPGKRDQAYDRIDRIGQIRPTTIHLVRDEKTIDDFMAGIMEQKEGVVGGFQTSVESLTGQDILDAIESGLI